jgi:leucyl aminopeptidase
MVDFSLKQLDLKAAAQAPADALIVLVPDDFLATRDPLSEWITQARVHAHLNESVGKLVQMWQAAHISAKRLVLVSCGQSQARQVRQAVTAAMGALKGSGAKHIIVSLPQAAQSQLTFAMQAVADAAYTYTATKPSAKPSTLRKVTVALPSESARKQALADFNMAQAVVQGIALAREWGNLPANKATPVALAKAAQQLARQPRLSCQVLGLKEIEKLGMGAFLAVAQGSAMPPRFIVLQYAGAAKTKAPVVLVGKGITFDTGGISLKPGAGMDEMKFDMCGAASVLGTFEALAQSKLPINVVGLIPTCENMPSGTAVKPGDVVTSMSGQTIEILNTDAEGRLILCDALTYAKKFKPDVVIDIATLTGACVMALGHVRSGLFSNNDELAQALELASQQSLDLCWRMPLDDDYAEGLKSNFADMANIAGREAGAISAAKFLQKFVGDYAWAHLDIAGSAWKSGAAKGATGRPVGLLMTYLAQRAQPVSLAKRSRA